MALSDIEIARQANKKPIKEVAKILNLDEDSLHPFGGMKKTSQWMNSILDNPLKIKNNNEFEIKLA